MSHSIPTRHSSVLSLRNRFIVLRLSIGIFIWGIFYIKNNPIDAITDLSENQVIVFTEWMGRSPQLVEDQITYPLVTNLQGLPKVNYVRATSMFGMSLDRKSTRLNSSH